MVKSDGMNDSKITIIIRTKDRPKQLGEALRSITEAQVPDVEVVVVNDGGVDVQNVITTTLTDGIPSNYLFLETSHGRSEAGNLGAEASRTPYIFFLDDDDLLAPGFLSLLKHFDTYHCPHGNLVLYGRVEAFLCNTDGSKRETYRIFGRDFDPVALLWENYIPFNAAIIPRDLFIRVGGLDSQLKVFEDWDLFLKLSEKAEFAYYPDMVAYYRLSENAFILGGSAELQLDCRIRILEKHREKYTPRSLANIYELFKRDLRHEFLPEVARFKAERKRWLEIDQERKTFIDELTEQISRKDDYIDELAMEIEKKGNYIDELAMEISRKGEYIEKLEHEKIQWHSMDSERTKFVRGLQRKVSDLKNLLPKADGNR